MWDADIYARYGKERIQPSIDLASRMSNKNFKRILDVGCGSGMSTASLLATWQDAEIVGVDLSSEMLQTAKEALPSITFIQRDCSKSLSNMGNFDLIFSNAFMQWIHNQEEFIKSSFDMLNVGGSFACQIPLFEEMPASQCINKAESVFHDSLADIEKNKYIVHSALDYYDMVSKCTSNITIWATGYYHEMDNHRKILDFLMGSALRPYINRLKNNEKNTFMDEVLSNIEKAYPIQKNGKVLFPFKRLFIIGEK